jgi:hypothetical protein
MDILYPRCAGLDVHKDSVVAAVRVAAGGAVKTEVRTFDTTTPGLLALSGWLSEQGCTHVAMEATGIYWKPVWHILSDGDVTLLLANAAHVKNVPGRKTDVADAVWLSDLLAHGLIRASFVPEPATVDARAAAHPQATRARAGEPRAAAAEDAGGRQHQALFRAGERDRPVRPCHHPGADRWRDRS